MPVPQKELRKAIKMGIKTLILQEVRLLRLENTLTPPLVMDEISHSIQDTKKEIVKLTKRMAPKERATLLKRMIRQAMDEEIDRAIELRKTRCVRCLHGRFYDETGTAHANLPVRTKAESVGCDKLRPSLRRSCRRFMEMSTAASLDQYLNEMTLLYEFRDVINRIEEVWKDYFSGR
jgi:hypothetical protein